MKSDELLQKLKYYNKDYYSAGDMFKIADISRRSVLVMLSRLVAAGKLKRLTRDCFVIPGGKINFELIAQQLVARSYISFESALARSGALSQIPYALTMATDRRSKKIDLGGQEVIYRKIKSNLFKGYVLQNRVKIATPEKALLDTVYVVSRGQSDFNFKELDFKVFKKSSLKSLAKEYPTYSRKLLDDILDC